MDLTQTDKVTLYAAGIQALATVLAVVWAYFQGRWDHSREVTAMTRERLRSDLLALMDEILKRLPNDDVEVPLMRVKDLEKDVLRVWGKGKCDEYAVYSNNLITYARRNKEPVGIGKRMLNLARLLRAWSENKAPAEYGVEPIAAFLAGTL